MPATPFYVSGHVKVHRDTARLLRKEITSGQDADAKAFTRKVLPTVDAPQKAVDRIADATGTSHR